MQNGFRTDLATEAVELDGPLAGVTEETQEHEGVTVTTVHIRTKRAAERLHKRVGRYVTIAPPPDAQDDHTGALVREITNALSALLPENARHLLVVGLGNRFITPDALGPRTAERVFVTRHIASFVPELAPRGMRHVSALIPGVLGVTGMETVEVIRGVVQSVRPDALLCIDALAAESPKHIGSTVQVNDNGLLPGAGVGNRQQELHEEALGLPVLAIGVPTVVFASSIAYEAARLMAVASGDAQHADTLAAMGRSVAQEHMGELIVTPKDVDKLITDASRRLAEGINRALHGPQYEELQALLLH